jgi:hypothetical protein
LRALTPASQAGAVRVFGLERPLAAGQTVFPAVVGVAHALSDSPARKGRAPGVLVAERPLREPAWLFWEDLAYGARFEHPSVLLLIGARSGRILRREAYDWWPLIDGREPPFMGAGYASSRYLIFPAGIKAAAAANGASNSSASPLASSLPAAGVFMPTAPPRARAAADPLPPDAFKGECLIVIGLYHDPQFTQDFVGIKAAAEAFQAHGLKGPYAPQTVTNGHIVEEPNGADLQKTVTAAITHQDCTDIMIYIDGHGYAAPGSKYPDGKAVKPVDASPHAQVIVGHKYTPAGHNAAGEQLYRATPRTLDSGDLKAILRAHPTTGFKFKIDACFSGRFVDELPREQYPNMLVLETASSDKEYSYSYLPEAWVKDGVSVDEGTAGATHYTSTTNNPGNSNAQHLGRGEFTNGNLAGFASFMSSQAKIDQAIAQGGSLLAHMLVDAFTDGAGQGLRADHRHHAPADRVQRARRPRGRVGRHRRPQCARGRRGRHDRLPWWRLNRHASASATPADRRFRLHSRRIRGCGQAASVG